MPNPTQGRHATLFGPCPHLLSPIPEETLEIAACTTLSVTFGYVPSSGDTFPGVIPCASLLNTFSAVPPGVHGRYSPTDLDLSGS